MKFYRNFCLTLIAGFSTISSMNVMANTDVHIKILQTTDVHGNFFPYNFITRTPWKGSLARVASVIDSVRAAAGKENVVLIDNGDILQGQPTVYYYNFIDTVSP